MIELQQRRNVTWKPLGLLSEAVSLIGGHLYRDGEKDFPAGGIVERVTEGGDYLWIETKRSPEAKTNGVALSIKHCEWTREEYLQCESGTFGCIVINDPINATEYSIHGVRLYS